LRMNFRFAPEAGCCFHLHQKLLLGRADSV
jgi:hypothetical protein